MIRAFSAAAFVLFISTSAAFSQGFSVNRLLIQNGSSSMCIVNPNESGKFVFRMPELPDLTEGEEMNLVVKAVGTADGVELTFIEAPEQLPQARIRNTEVGVKQDGQLNSVSGIVYPRTTHRFAEIDIPLMMPNGTFVAKIDMIGVKAGAAISISPATDMGGLTGPIYAWAPIDCVVMIKFSNPGGESIDPVGMQFAVGAINPM